MLVRYFYHIGVVAEFDPRSGHLRITPRPQGMSLDATDGWFAVLDGGCIVFYRDADHLWLRIGRRLFDLDNDASVAWHEVDGMSVFTARDRQGSIVVNYPSGPDISDDPTPGIEAEDFDLGLFIANVTSDQERSDLVRRGSS